MSHSPLLTEFEGVFDKQGKPILDLACGNGRNGLYLHQQGLPVKFADNNAQQLSTLQLANQLTAEQCWHVDFETGEQILAPNSMQAILVYRYLHRPLIEQIKNAIVPGGILIYETFTVNNRQFGRPNRDAFLLHEHELKNLFEDWQCLHYFEGVKQNPERAIAQIVCRKPQLKNTVL